MSAAACVDTGQVRSALRRLAGSEERLPPVLAVAWQQASATVQIRVAPDLHWFRGHFPEHPVLPGIVQVDWAVLLCRVLFAYSHNPDEIRRLKFRSMIEPPEDVELTLRRTDGQLVDFSYTGAGRNRSEGRLVFPEYCR